MVKVACDKEPTLKRPVEAAAHPCKATPHTRGREPRDFT